MRIHFVFICTLIFASGSLVFAGVADAQVDYATQIRPILSNKCYPCHGPDENTREGGIRFDLKASALGEADSGEFAIVPGQTDDSELVRRIHAEGGDVMPPRSEEKQLTDAEKELLKKWIAEGAKWQNHWAFEPPVRHTLPKVNDQAWVKNEIDRFVLAQLESRHLKPGPRASRESLIRRVTFDLTGLPPTIKEIDDFLSDKSPNAFEKVVDRLLASPHYGENMASIWLDAARFADTNGYQNDFRRDMWPWRDWVIQAYNQNKPFDQFVLEQIAGDLLPNATRDQLVATGFNRNHRTVTEGGSIEQEWLVENVVDRVETTATVFLGLTMGCARCHDHKYDPISQKEFYQFFAYFYNVEEKGFHSERRGNTPPLITVRTRKHDLELAKFDQRLKKLNEQMMVIKKNLDVEKARWEKELAAKKMQSWKSDHVFGILQDSEKPRPASIEQELVARRQKEKIDVSAGPFGQSLKLASKPNSHLSLSGGFDFEESSTFSVSAWVRPTRFGAIISRMDASNNYRGFDMLLMANGQMNVHLIHQWPQNAIKITTDDRIELNRWSHVCVTYDGSSKSKGLRVYFNGKPSAFKVNVDALQGTSKTDHPIWIGNRGFTTPYAGQISDLKIHNRILSAEEIVSRIERGVQPLVQLAKKDRSKNQVAAIDDLFKASFANEFAKVDKEIRQVKKERAQFERSIPTTMVMKERATPRECYVLTRGQYDMPDKSQRVDPATPAFLPKASLESLPRNRLGLAKWLVDKNNPLTSRVAVNRYWQRIFGRGLLETVEDFGVQSPLPSHPKLLDWLAVEFRENEWDIKAIQKKIVMSATYQQSSSGTPESFRADPDNRNLARGPRIRLSAEQIRDQALAVSGLLKRQIGGPSIKPYQPEGLWKELAGGAGQGPYIQDKDDRLYRRSLYIYRKRTVPHPTMTTFDAGSRETCQVIRSRTNTPLQALALLNDRTYVEAARNLAQNILQSNENQTARLTRLFRRAIGRAPDEKELDILEKRADKYVRYFRANPDEAKKYLSNGLSKADSKFDFAELAGYSVIASIVLNLDEAITKK